MQTGNEVAVVAGDDGGGDPADEPCSAREQTGPGGSAGPMGLFGSLLDRSFDQLVTLKMTRLLYTLALLFVTGMNLVVFLIGWSLAAGTFWPFLGWVLMTGTPVAWLFELVTVRVVIEFVIVQFKISEDLRILRDAVKDLRAT